MSLISEPIDDSICRAYQCFSHANIDVNDSITYFFVHLYLEVLKHLSTYKMNKTALIKVLVECNSVDCMIDNIMSYIDCIFQRECMFYIVFDIYIYLHKCSLDSYKVGSLSLIWLLVVQWHWLKMSYRCTMNGKVNLERVCSTLT